MKNFKKLTFILLSSTAVLLLTAGITSAQQTSDQLFEKALYAEEMKGDLGEAVKIYQQVLKENPGNRQVSARALLHIGMCYEKLGSEQARLAYQDVIGKYSDQVREASLAKERITRLEAFTAEFNREAENHMKNGNELFKRWEYESAVREYENAIKLRPNTSLALNAQYCIGQSWFRAGKYNTALATFTKLIEENPKSNIAPVAELMVSQVQNAMENDKSLLKTDNPPDENIIIDPETGITYRKIKTFTGKNDVIEWTPGTTLSPDGKFLIKNNTIVPMNGNDPFKFIDMQVGESIWSPDGKIVAFTVGDSSLFIVPVSLENGKTTGPAKNLLNKHCYIFGINWSPDSKRLFYSIIDYGGKNYPEIWSMSVPNGLTQPLTSVAATGGYPDCSPDGKTVAFRDPSNTIWFCPSEGGIPKKFIDRKNNVNPYWTPDGEWIFSDETVYGGGRELGFIRLSDKLEIKLNPPERTGSYLSYSSDGKKIMFYRPSKQLFWGLKVASASGGPSYEPVPHLPVYGAVWSTDSKMIIVQGEKYNKMEEGDAAIRIVPITGGESFLMDIDVNVDGKTHHYNVSPDQKYILFEAKKENDEEDLYMAPISVEEARITGPAIRIIENWTYSGGYNTKLSWSRDRTKIAIIHKNDIMIFSLKNKELIRVTNTPELRKSWVAWSPDGSMLSYQYFPDKPDNKKGSRIIPSEGGEPITFIENLLLMPSDWSPDSRSVVFCKDVKLIRQNILKGDLHVILDLNTYGLQGASISSWSPDGKYMVIDGGKKSEPEKSYLYKIPAEGGELTDLATGDSGSIKYDIAWSPDGKWICYCYYEPEKVRPESTLWEADFDEIKEKLAK